MAAAYPTGLSPLAPPRLRAFAFRLPSDAKRNQKLHAWWPLDFPTFRKEVTKALKTDIPLKERGDWEHALQTWQTDHTRLTAQLVAIEEESNARVYRRYGLSPADVQLLDQHAQHAMINCAYGEP